MTVPFCFPVVIFSDRNWCVYFDTTDGWLSVILDGHMVVGDLRFIPTNGQTTVPFFSGHNFSGRNFLEASQNTKHNTHRHNNQQDEQATLPSSVFAPSLSMGGAVVPPNCGAAAPRHHAQAASYQGCDCCCWFAGLGRQNKRHQIIERRGVLWS
jgi:hypothetical protein